MEMLVLGERNPICDATEYYLSALSRYVVTRPSVSHGLILP